MGILALSKWAFVVILIVKLSIHSDTASANLNLPSLSTVENWLIRDAATVPGSVPTAAQRQANEGIHALESCPQGRALIDKARKRLGIRIPGEDGAQAAKQTCIAAKKIAQQNLLGWVSPKKNYRGSETGKSLKISREGTLVPMTSDMDGSLNPFVSEEVATSGISRSQTPAKECVAADAPNLVDGKFPKKFRRLKFFGSAAAVATGPQIVQSSLQRHWELVDEFPDESGVVAQAGSMLIQGVEEGLVSPICSVFALPLGWANEWDNVPYGVNLWNADHREAILNLPGQAADSWGQLFGYVYPDEDCLVEMAPPLD